MFSIVNIWFNVIELSIFKSVYESLTVICMPFVIITCTPVNYTGNLFGSLCACFCEMLFCWTVHDVCL